MKLVVGNWKMFVGTQVEAEVLVRSVKKAAGKASAVRVVICPPAPYISRLARIAPSVIAVGAQNSSHEAKGAWTGEVAATVLKDVGATHVILGHSERRALGETDAIIARKAVLAVKAGLTVILCVGEKDRVGEGGEQYAFVRDQLLASLEGFPSRGAGSLVIAYEPVWAIGSSAKRAATPQDCREMVVLIRKHLSGLFGQRAAFATPILYGGSVDEKNAAGFMTSGAADGLLIGRASAENERFSAIINLTQKISS